MGLTVLLQVLKYIILVVLTYTQQRYCVSNYNMKDLLNSLTILAIMEQYNEDFNYKNNLKNVGKFKTETLNMKFVNNYQIHSL